MWVMQVNTARLRARVVWTVAEHFDLEGLDPLLADDPDDPLNIIIDHIHKVLFNLDSSATSSNRSNKLLLIFWTWTSSFWLRVSTKFSKWIWRFYCNQCTSFCLNAFDTSALQVTGCAGLAALLRAFGFQEFEGRGSCWQESLRNLEIVLWPTLLTSTRAVSYCRSSTTMPSIQKPSE